MNWLRTHTLTALSLGAGVLLITGAFVVVEQVPQSATNGSSAWTTASGLQSPLAPITNPVLAQLPEPSFNTYAPSFLPIPPQQPLGDETPVSGDTDLATLLAALAQPSSAQTQQSATASTSLAYDFIPHGLISLSAPAAQRSTAQQALYDYGNEVGSLIQTYEARSGNVPQILKDQIEDRQSAQKAQAVKDIGAELAHIGTSMEKMDRVPQSAASAHLALAKSYEEIGANLAKVPDAQGDQAYIAAIEAYDASADRFSKNFVALAGIFSLAGVKFSSTDPGSVFSFSAGGGL